MTSRKKIALLLADDHALVREGLASLLASEPGIEVVAQASDGETALAAIREHRPAVAVLDHSMPGRTGLEVLQAITAEKLPTRAIMLSSFGSPLLVAEAVRAGAAAYLMKDDAFDDLREAVAHVADEKPFLSRSLDRAGLRDAMTSLPVTEREAEILALILEGKSARAIGEQLGIGQRTVETHRESLMGKFAARNSLELVRNALASGLAT